MISHSLRAPAITDVLLARGGSAVYVRSGAGCANIAEPTLTPRKWLNVEHPYRNDARRHRHGRRTTYQHGVAAALVGCAQSRSSAGRWAVGGAARRPTGRASGCAPRNDHASGASRCAAPRAMARALQPLLPRPTHTPPTAHPQAAAACATGPGGQGGAPTAQRGGRPCLGCGLAARRACERVMGGRGTAERTPGANRPVLWREGPHCESSDLLRYFTL